MMMTTEAKTSSEQPLLYAPKIAQPRPVAAPLVIRASQLALVLGCGYGGVDSQLRWMREELRTTSRYTSKDSYSTRVSRGDSSLNFYTKIDPLAPSDPLGVAGVFRALEAQAGACTCMQQYAALETRVASEMFTQNGLLQERLRAAAVENIVPGDRELALSAIRMRLSSTVPGSRERHHLLQLGETLTWLHNSTNSLLATARYAYGKACQRVLVDTWNAAHHSENDLIGCEEESHSKLLEDGWVHLVGRVDGRLHGCGTVIEVKGHTGGLSRSSMPLQCDVLQLQAYLELTGSRKGILVEVALLDEAGRLLQREIPIEYDAPRMRSLLSSARRLAQLMHRFRSDRLLRECFFANSAKVQGDILRDELGLSGVHSGYKRQRQ